MNESDSTLEKMENEMIKKNNLLSVLSFMFLLLICNIHLFRGDSPSLLIFDQVRVADGEWWRIITHPLVHVSWYHLILDALVVMIVWSELQMQSLRGQVVTVALCVGGSLLASLWFSPYIALVGFCGLSGLAHGLTFLLGLIWAKQSTFCSLSNRATVVKRCIAIALLVLTFGKSVYEVSIGRVIFGSMHFGELGIPIVHSHLGGVIGGLLAFMIAGRWGLLSCQQEDG